VTCNAGVAQG